MRLVGLKHAAIVSQAIPYADPSNVARWISDGLVYSTVLGPLVATATNDPLTEEEFIFVAASSRGLVATEDGRQVLAAELREHCRPDLAHAIVRIEGPLATELGNALEESQWAPYLCYLSKGVAPSKARASEVHIERASARTAGFVRGLLADALVLGYAASDRAVRRKAAGRYVATAYQSFSAPDGPRAYVARIDGVLAGHTTFEAHVDEVTGEAFIEVVDVFVLPDFASRGVTGALLAELEAGLPAGTRLLGNVVAEPDGKWRAVMTNLLRNDWRLQYELWSCDLGHDAA